MTGNLYTPFLVCFGTVAKSNDTLSENVSYIAENKISSGTWCDNVEDKSMSKTGLDNVPRCTYWLKLPLTTKVPLFINQGEKILISTADGKYAGRA